ncbi:DUF2199 domain-containing protein [Myxococcota bacterium]|nr:DUF2199 domain-containing protein [Myxococcota bacterium]MBU1380436.1 DUF2199 domain-containing protein [Myxococcota bacterium]MBU1498370.1 DUF2199 domain-containing protein [Myxococcota bacterium]
MTFRFKCATCKEVHSGMPTFGSEAPLSYYEVPEREREARCDLGSDDCVIDGKFFFVRGCIDIPVHGQTEPFSWGGWVSISQESYMKWLKCFHKKQRSHIGPFFGWLNTWLSPYPETINLKTMVHLRNNVIRPYIELEPTDHPLAVEQRDGISVERVAEIYAHMVHGDT